MVPVPARPLLRVARLFERRSTGAVETRLSTALGRLGPSYVKLGQFLATRPDVVGAGMARDLERLQDQMPPFPQAEAEAAIAASFGRPVAAVFASFGPPVAAASIAQVHQGNGGDGRRAARRRGQGACGRASNGAFTPTSRPSPSPRDTPRISPPRRAGCVSSRWSILCAAQSWSKWTSAWKRRRFRKWPKTPRTIRIFACRRSTGTAPPRKC